jgi:DNA-binding MarR family transcriptional regulator/N-acetylglutamate synthase-like GNAT family acetyltransferase
MTVSRADSSLASQISLMRGFNRFYTARLGLLRRHHLGGDFSLTEARILHEICAHPRITASALRDILEMDGGYLSRLLTAQTSSRLIRQVSSTTDRREKHLILTPAGKKAVAWLNDRSDKQLLGMLARISPRERTELEISLKKVWQILSKPEEPDVRVERLASMTSAAHDLLEEYYEAVHVVQRDKPESTRRLLEEPGSGMWLAYLGEHAVGCVVLRNLASVPFAGECKRLYVKPAARGNRISDRLMDALEEFARGHGLRWIYLDSYDDLKTAIALYQRRGYRRCARYNDNPQATVFMRKRLR